MKKQMPILFSTMMVQAILAGRKTVTRCTTGLDEINKAPNSWTLNSVWRSDKGCVAVFDRRENLCVKEVKRFICPYGQPGDILWVRETFLKREPRGEFGPYGFKADMKHQWKGPIKWKPSIHMPKVAARIWLEVTGIRVERLRDISEEEAIAEGVMLHERVKHWLNYLDQEAKVTQFNYNLHSARDSFRTLWQLINGRESWQANPWVWVVSYRVLSTTGKPAGLEKEVAG